MSAGRAAKIEDSLADEVSNFYADLYGFIMFAYPWGEKGTELEHFKGPERWIAEVADEISDKVALHKFDNKTPVPVIYVGIASGNGCAKSTFAAMVVDWIMSTRPLCQGTVTANTGAQLATKTWPQIEKWTKLCITSGWWNIQSESVRHKLKEKDWAVNAVTWSLQNTQSFAGQHARTSSSFYVFDEASHTPEEIMEQADGGLLDGEPFFILLGNPTNRFGRLYRSVFGNLQKDYIHRSIDSRTCEYTNKQEIANKILERGEDSDWVRSHIKGLPPNAEHGNFIGADVVSAAMKREAPPDDKDQNLIMAIDFARGGKAWNIIAWRKGRDARSIPWKEIPGEHTADTTKMVSIILSEILDKKPDAVFGDSTGVGGPIMDRIRELVRHIPVIDINNGDKSPDASFGNLGAYAWNKMREWLKTGCVPDDEGQVGKDGNTFFEQATSRAFWHTPKGRLMLESKEDMEDDGRPSPDKPDALSISLAHELGPKKKFSDLMPSRANMNRGKSGKYGWMGH